MPSGPISTDARSAASPARAAGRPAATLTGLRSITHALRGWPTPLGVAVDTSEPVFAAGAVGDPAVLGQLEVLADQVVGFALDRHSHYAGLSHGGARQAARSASRSSPEAGRRRRAGSSCCSASSTPTTTTFRLTGIGSGRRRRRRRGCGRKGS